MKPLTLFIVFDLIFCSKLSAQVPDSVKFKSLEPYNFHMVYLKADKSVLIDVREFFEYRVSRIKGALNIPSSANLDLAADTIDKQCTLFLYCTSGYRSKKVAGFLYDKGFSKLYSLDGGIVAWRKEKMPVVKKRVKRNGAMAQRSHRRNK